MEWSHYPFAQWHWRRSYSELELFFNRKEKIDDSTTWLTNQHFRLSTAEKANLIRVAAKLWTEYQAKMLIPSTFQAIKWSVIGIEFPASVGRNICLLWNQVDVEIRLLLSEWEAFVCFAHFYASPDNQQSDIFLWFPEIRYLNKKLIFTLLIFFLLSFLFTSIFRMHREETWPKFPKTDNQSFIAKDSLCIIIRILFLELEIILQLIELAGRNLF